MKIDLRIGYSKPFTIDVPEEAIANTAWRWYEQDIAKSVQDYIDDVKEKRKKSNYLYFTLQENKEAIVEEYFNQIEVNWIRDLEESIERVMERKNIDWGC